MTLEQLGWSKFALQGKQVHVQPNAVNAEECQVKLPPLLFDYYKDVELSVDVLHMNSIPFLGSISKHIHYVTTNALENIKIPTMEVMIKRIMRLYAVWGFHVTLIHVDIQFKGVKDQKTTDRVVNMVSKGEHVPEIERMN